MLGVLKDRITNKVNANGGMDGPHLRPGLDSATSTAHPHSVPCSGTIPAIVPGRLRADDRSRSQLGSTSRGCGASSIRSRSSSRSRLRRCLIVGADGGTSATAAAAVFAASVAACFGASALYHRVTWTPRARLWMRRIDHAGVYLLIAGTYTPVSLLVLQGAWRPVVLTIVWAGAARRDRAQVRLGRSAEMARSGNRHRTRLGGRRRASAVDRPAPSCGGDSCSSSEALPTRPVRSSTRDAARIRCRRCSATTSCFTR